MLLEELELLELELPLEWLKELFELLEELDLLLIEVELELELLDELEDELERLDLLWELSLKLDWELRDWELLDVVELLEELELELLDWELLDLELLEDVICSVLKDVELLELESLELLEELELLKLSPQFQSGHHSCPSILSKSQVGEPLSSKQ